MENREDDELPFPDVGVSKPMAKFVRQPSRANRLTKTDSLVGQIILSPAEKVHFLLGGDSQFDDSIQVHPLFCELEELTVSPTGEMEWSEAARWVKFEEAVEIGGARWSKPRVASLTLHSIFELRSIISKGVVLLDCNAASLDGIFNQAVGKIADEQKLDATLKDEIVSLLLHKHRHLHELRKDLPLMADKKLQARRPSVPSRSLITSSSSARFPSSPSSAGFLTDYSDDVPKKNKAFMRKLPPGAESAVLLVGEYEGLERPVSAFIRLTNPQVFGDLIEVDVPTKFIFFHIGPVGSSEANKEVGRSLATMLVDEVFHEVVYRSKNRENLLAGVDEFIDNVTALPPGEWDPDILLEPPNNVPSQESRKKPEPLQLEHVDLDKEELEYLQSQGLVRTGRIFGGLINDIKRKAPWYLSDFTDAFHVQSIASITFLYFASLSPIITFGGLLGDATEDRLAAIESLIGGCLCGLIFSLFSGQPLSLLNATGPVLVFETILYNFCKVNDFYYLTVRFWVGAWMGLIMLILCALDISAWVCFITRFTEENFALLIASVYVYKAVENIIKIYHKYPMSPPDVMNITGDCFCTPSGGNFTGGNFTGGALNWTGMAANECSMLYNGTVEGTGCLEEQTPYEPNVFLMSVLLASFTFWLCVKLKHFKHELYFSYKVRCLISDFSVFICIVSMTALDWASGIATPKLSVPATITPTWPERGWTVPIFHENVPVWLMIACSVPAALATILLFLDQQITSVIVNRKDNLLKKGCGYHLDLFVLAFLVVLMGYCGLPWHVAGTVICLNHVDSLRKESETAAPGDKPKFFGIR
ncbi:hypothetical protein QYM36_001817 [Artemia franciscana]|nr:hypothetical protein QYM36_001817 [Artemia franciscana]